MKTLRIIFAFAAVAFTIASCKEDGVKARLRGDVSPNELKAPAGAPYVLVTENKAAVMETFKWTATNFGFPASVTYTVQIDSTGKNFANAVDVLSTTALEGEVTVGNFNDLLLSLGYVPESAGSLDIRVRSRIGDNIDPVYSNTRTVTVTDYATSFLPIWGMGSGLKGWGPWPDSAVEWQSSEYKKYETVTYLTTGNIFRWFNQLDWNPTSYNYNYFTGGVSAIFELNTNDSDNNLKVVGATGWYKINVDLTAKTVVAVAVDEPTLFMMGGALNGWGPWHSKEVKMKYIKPGVFVADATFGNDIFRFFAQADWGPTSYAYPYFTTVDENFVLNTNDTDNNLRFIGTPGVQHITVDLNALTVILGVPPTPHLYMMGDALPGGWGTWGTDDIDMDYVSPGIWETTTTFTNGGAFRFFAQADWNPTSYAYPYFTTVDPAFANANDTDSNLKFVGTTGSHKVRVDITSKTVTFTP